jgi:DNA polymerase III epsilon subunit-like protein
MRKNQHDELQPNRNHRYRLPPETATRLGLDLNKNNRYSLTEEQEAIVFGYDQVKIKRLFFDIETSPMIVYSWRVGWKLNIPTDNIIEDWKIICISYKWEDEDKVQTLSWKNKCDKQLLIDFIKIANQADELIAHNGDRFDIKKIRTRCVYHRIPMFPNYRTLDTLKKAKSGFNFNSNRLDYIAKFLGVGAKLEHEGFNMWVKCMQGDEQALKDMVEYCEMDIIVLEDVWFVLQNYIKNNTHSGTHNGKLKASCPTCGSEDISLLKNNFTASGTIKRQLECNPCGYVYETSNSAWRTFLELQQNKQITI